MATHKVIALSTMWGIGRHLDMASLAEKAREMGFSHLELNYQVTASMLEELRNCPGLAISSVHSPCPGRELPDGRWTYRLRLTADDGEERRPALESALETVDTAVALAVPVVVLHAGSVPLPEGLEPKLRELYRNGDGQNPQFRELRDELLAQRDSRKGPYLEAAFESLRRIVDHARERGIKIGLESRYYFHEIPTLEEMVTLLDEFGDAVGYWHDVGHAENLARLGFTPHRDWLEALSHRMVGIHLHDIEALADHQAPGKGSLDLASLARYLPNDAIRVCELASSNSEEEVRAGLALLKKLGIVEGGL